MLAASRTLGFTESWRGNRRRSRRAGDHAKNLAEEVCHFVSGRSIRHVLMAYDKPKVQMFIEWLRHKDEQAR